MSALRYIADIALPAALSMLPEQMDSPQARAMSVACCLQESRCKDRRQLVGSPPRPEGPAMGFGQFECGGGIAGALTHHATKQHITRVLDAMGYDHRPETSWLAVRHNDILMMVYVRLNLWWLPGPLPERGHCEYAWGYYLDAWRPGIPHRHTWDAFYEQAWQTVAPETA